MILRKISFLAMLMITILSFQSCNDDESSSSTSRVQLFLVDAPGDYDQVNVEVIDIQYNNSEDEEGWRSFAPPEGGYPSKIDLTKLVGGESLGLTDEIIESGMLKQIRLVLAGNNTLVLEGSPTDEIPLNTPSALQSGLKLNLNEELVPGFSYTYILDWDVQKSVVEAGGSGIYNLKPVIRVNTLVNSGSIKGNVIGKLTSEDTDTALLEGVSVLFFAEGDLAISVGSTSTNEFGDFIIQGLDAGNYVLKIEEDVTYTAYVSELLEVKVGEVNELDTSIELLLK